MASYSATSTSAKIVHFKELEIATETFGERQAAPVLLIMGAMASMLWWPDELCRRLAAGGCFVIRYDNRDTGLSTKYPPGSPLYTIDDMARDAVLVLDAYSVKSAHVIGMSLGGTIAQILALTSPERVSTLTLISTTPIGLDLELPPSSPAYMTHAADGEHVDWSDRRQAVDFVAKDALMISGSAHPHNAEQTRAFVERDYDRSGGYLSATNHFMLQGGQTLQGKLPTLAPPLLVVHGTADPIYPPEHGAALASAVPGAKHFILEGGGHELHKDNWDRIAGAFVAHALSE